MSLTGSLENQNIGGGGWGGWGNGWGGGVSPFGLVGLIGLLGRRGLGGDGDGDCGGCGKEAALLAAISNAKDATNAVGTNLVDRICDVSTNLQAGFYNAAIANIGNTQSIKDQMTAFQIQNTAQFQDVDKSICQYTAAILARLNQTENDALRDALHLERRGRDADKIDISIQNSNAQAQAQFQAQNNELFRRFDLLFGQLAKSNQDIVNLGTMIGNTQSSSATNIK